MEYSELDKELQNIEKSLKKELREEYKTKFTTKPTTSGDTDLSPSAKYNSFTGATVIPKEVDSGYEEMAVQTYNSDSKQWKNMKNKFQKMDWEQPEPNESDFQSKDVQSIAKTEVDRLNHNKSVVKSAYKKHEIPDTKSMAHLEKMNTKSDKTTGDPLLWANYRQYFRPKNRMKK